MSDSLLSHRLSFTSSFIHGIFQARVLEWVAISFSKGSSWPRDRTQVSLIAVRGFTVWAIRETHRHESECLFDQLNYPNVRKNADNSVENYAVIEYNTILITIAIMLYIRSLKLIHHCNCNYVFFDQDLSFSPPPWLFQPLFYSRFSVVLDCTYKWDNLAFFFLYLAYFI